MSRNLKAGLILALTVLAALAVHLGLTRQYSDWVPVDGVVMDIQFHHATIRRRIHDSYEIHYTYQVDGRTYSGVNAYSGRKTDRFVGEAVTVWYDPDAPGDSSFHPPGPGLQPLIPVFLGIWLMLRVLKANRKGRKYRGTNKRQN